MMSSAKFYKKCRKSPFFYDVAITLLFIDFLFLNMTLKQGKI